MRAPRTLFAVIIRPHTGPQERFLSSAADIAIFGGAAGGGKSWALLLETLRHVTTNPRFAAVYFRRNTTQIKNPGGLWDQSMRLYPYTGGVPNHTLEWRWADGGRVKFGHLEHEVSKLDWHGAELPLICFDELTTFTSTQFWYLLSRNRSMSGVKGYIRASCNPDADSWVAELIEWWIDQESGVPINERSGVIRYFVRIDDRLQWADTPGELVRRYPGTQPKSLTFIGATLADNPTLEASDPGYRANLMAMQLVERERLLGGNWKIRPSAGLYFQRHWCPIVDVAPAVLKRARGWDLAGTINTGTNNPDWTATTKMGRTPDGRYIVLDAKWMQGSPAMVKRFIKQNADADGIETAIHLPQDPAQAGKAQAQDFISALAGFNVHAQIESGQKITRFSPFSAQAEAGNVMVLRAPWNERYFSELEAFPEAAHDDMPDSTATAFRALTRFFVPIGTGFVGVASREQEGWSVFAGELE
jgi:predicted phage terminase large subunit-like protein